MGFGLPQFSLVLLPPLWCVCVVNSKQYMSEAAALLDSRKKRKVEERLSPPVAKRSSTHSSSAGNSRECSLFVFISLSPTPSQHIITPSFPILFLLSFHFRNCTFSLIVVHVCV